MTYRSAQTALKLIIYQIARPTFQHRAQVLQRCKTYAAHLTHQRKVIFAMRMWVAFRFSSFVMSFLFGIGGTLVALAVAITGTTQADGVSLGAANEILTASDPARIVLIGGLAALVVLGLMVIDLSQRSFR